MISKTLMTVEDFAELATSETEDFERSDRELIGMSSASPMHGFVCGTIEFAVQTYLQLHPMGELSVKLTAAYPTIPSAAPTSPSSSVIEFAPLIPARCRFPSLLISPSKSSLPAKALLTSTAKHTNGSQQAVRKSG